MRRKLEAEMSNIKASDGIAIPVRKDSPFFNENTELQPWDKKG